MTSNHGSPPGLASMETELNSHYESLEKLHSLVLAENFALEKRDINILPEISHVKRVLLANIDEMRGELEQWSTQLSCHSATADRTDIQTPVCRLRNLATAIVELERANTQLIQDLNEGLSQEEMEIGLCDWKKQASGSSLQAT